MKDKFKELFNNIKDIDNSKKILIRDFIDMNLIGKYFLFQDPSTYHKDVDKMYCVKSYVMNGSVNVVVVYQNCGGHVTSEQIDYKYFANCKVISREIFEKVLIEIMREIELPLDIEKSYKQAKKPLYTRLAKNKGH